MNGQLDNIDPAFAIPLAIILWTAWLIQRHVQDRRERDRG